MKFKSLSAQMLQLCEEASIDVRVIAEPVLDQNIREYRWSNLCECRCQTIPKGSPSVHDIVPFPAEEPLMQCGRGYAQIDLKVRRPAVGMWMLDQHAVHIDHDRPALHVRACQAHGAGLATTNL